jgi:hypothetical protein
MGLIKRKKTDQAAQYRLLRWRNTLFLRVILLCGVLLVCLLGSVTVITVYFFREVVQEMEVQTKEIARSIVLQFEEKPDINYDEVKHNIKDLYSGFDVDFQPYSGDIGNATFTLEREPDAGGARSAAHRRP